MNVNIVDIQNEKVIFSSKYGTGIAKYNSDLYFMLPDNCIYVELDIAEDLFFGLNVNVVESIEAKITFINDTCIIVGKLEEIEDDNYCIVRVGGSIFPCVIFDSEKYLGRFIELKTNELIITPVNY